MIDKILPCPECGEYPDFVSHYDQQNQYSISTNCYCEDTEEFIDGMSGAHKDLISTIQAWNEFSEAGKTIKVKKSDLEYFKTILENNLKPYSTCVESVIETIKEYLTEKEDDCRTKRKKCTDC